MARSRAPSPRFQRPHERPNVRVTADDDAIIWHAFRHRIVDSEAVYSLFPNRSRDKLSRRLNLLRKAGYLDRIPQQVDRLRYRIGGGSDSFLYALDLEGARRLRERFGVDVRLYGWSEKNRELGWKHIEHTLSVTHFMVDLELSARTNSHLRIKHFDEILAAAPEATRKRPQPERFRTPLQWRGEKREEGIAPDAIFGLEVQAPNGKPQSAYYYLELDRGTETIEPTILRGERFFRRSSILQKLVVYTGSHQNRTHERIFGLPPVRYLFMTTEPERVKRMQETYQRHIAPRPLAMRPGAFLFADFHTRREHAGDFLSMPWQTAAGTFVHLDGREVM